MAIRVGINGFGRIGRQVLRAAKQQGVVDLDFVAVNDLGSLETMAHLLKYDSVLGVLPQTIKATKSSITVDDDEIQVLQVRDPAELPWGELGVDLVVGGASRVRVNASQAVSDDLLRDAVDEAGYRLA